MNLYFNKVWASDTSPEYPTDTQAKRGLSFLGTEAPTFDLHDAIFQRLDNKALWLYDQVRNACERFGQKVQNDDGSLVSDARDIMANAITYALLNQRKADEGGHGIVRMANADQTNAGNDYNLAVSPRHLAEYVSAQNTWANTKDKPQTALRWPDYSEVTGTPNLGTAAYRPVEYFELHGAVNSLEKRLGDSAFWNVKKDNGLAYDYGKLVSEGSVKAEIDNLGAASRWGVQEKTGVQDQEYGTGNLAREASLAEFRDWLESFKRTLKSASMHDASDFDAAGAAQAVLDALNRLDRSLSSIAKSGNITDATGNLSLDRINGVGDAATFSVNTTNFISYDYGKIPSEGTIKAQFDNLGQASSWGVQEDWDYEKANFGTGLLAREGSIAALRDALRSTTGTLSLRLAKYKGKGSIGEGGIVPGSDLLPASAEYSFDGNPLSGQWKCLGVCRGADTNIHGQQTTFWVRIS